MNNPESAVPDKPSTFEHPRDGRVINSQATGFTSDFARHALTPTHFGQVEGADGLGSPHCVCGDTVEIGLKVQNGVITRVAFQTDGCLHTVACVDSLCAMIQGHRLALAWSIQAEHVTAALGGLPPEHRHCAQLAVDTLRLALQDYLRNSHAPWRKLYRPARHAG